MSKGPVDHEAREQSLAVLANAPVGALYEVTRECGPDEDVQTYTWAYLKIAANEWRETSL